MGGEEKIFHEMLSSASTKKVTPVPNSVTTMRHIKTEPPPLKESDIHAVLAPRTRELVEGEISALEFYVGKGYRVNDKLRQRSAFLNNQEANLVQGIDAVFDKTDPMERSILVHRGIDRVGADSIFGPVGSRVGSVFVDHGYTSTSSASDNPIFFGRAIMRIKVPAGVKAIDMLPWSDVKSEREVLLPRGTRFLVTGDMLVGKSRNITLEVQP